MTDGTVVRLTFPATLEQLAAASLELVVQLVEEGKGVRCKDIGHGRVLSRADLDAARGCHGPPPWGRSYRARGRPKGVCAGLNVSLMPDAASGGRLRRTGGLIRASRRCLRGE